MLIGCSSRNHCLCRILRLGPDAGRSDLGILEFKLLALLFVANGTPILAKRLLGARLAKPVDAGSSYSDGRPWLGPAKTWRGLVLAPVVTAVAALLMDLDPLLGALIAVLAMVGDLITSFLKRRMGLASSSRALGMDQVPEALLPLLVCMPLLDIGVMSVVLILVAFTLGSLLLSRLLYRLGIRERPY